MRLAETTIVVMLGAATAGAAEPAQPVAPLAPGAWGGAHAQIQVAEAETRVELECAHGVIPGVLTVGKNGAVDTLGSVVRHGAGPGEDTDAGAGEPARFRGTLAGKTLTLTVTLVGPSQELGTFKLTRGKSGRLTTCSGAS